MSWASVESTEAALRQAIAERDAARAEVEEYERRWQKDAIPSFYYSEQIRAKLARLTSGIEELIEGLAGHDHDPDCEGGADCFACLEEQARELLAEPHEAQGFIVARTIDTKEAPWLPHPITRGMTVYRCIRPTFGVAAGFPATFDPEGGYPFFDLPPDAIGPRVLRRQSPETEENL